MSLRGLRPKQSLVTFITLQRPCKGRFYFFFMRLPEFFVTALYRGNRIQVSIRGDMNKLDVKPPAIAISPASFLDLQPAARLIVLVPEFEADSAIVARKIRDVAKALESRIQLIGLSKDASHEPSVRRRLVTLSALVEDQTIFVESKVEFGNSWLNAVLPHWHQGDVIVCFAEQHSGFGSKPVHQILQANLNATVYVLSGVQMQKEHSRPVWLSNTMAWAGSIGLILGFFWLQARLIQPAQNGIQSALLYGSLIVEAGSIWAWNNLFN
jgi:hypothetical protein